MSIHSSLKSGSGASAALKNVQKRHERIRAMLEKEQWEEGKSVYGLPKLKQPRVKVGKGKK